ncbi:MAG: hypothetical protein OK454_01270 [Thaumarchaeota archaeon]|nr:hypothetical protein [Nitrososphaerota archaeon]
METRMKTTVYAKNLRARLTELRTEYEAAKKKYTKDLATWREELKNWLAMNGRGRVDSISRTELKDRYRGTQGFDTQIFFSGAPKPPTYPSDARIRAVQKALHYLAVTGQTEVKVSSDDVEKFFDKDEG